MSLEVQRPHLEVDNLGLLQDDPPTRGLSGGPISSTFLGVRKETVTHLQGHLSSVENPGLLFDIGDYTTQLYGDYNKPI